MGYYPGIPLDELTDIVRVSWEQDTILDFVHDKYRVKSKRQTRPEVLEAAALSWVQTPVAVPGFESLPFEGIGLDLLGPLDIFGMPTTFPTRSAKLRNKTATPSAQNPGALNEFTFLNYTIVIEFDWFDIAQAFYNREGGFDPVSTGGWDSLETPFESRYTRTNEGSPDGNFTLSQTLQREDYTVGGTLTGDNDYDRWIVQATDLTEVGSPGGTIAHSNLGEGVRYFKAADPPGTGSCTFYSRDVFYQYGAPIGCGYEFLPGMPFGGYCGTTGTQPSVFQAGVSSSSLGSDWSEYFTRPSLQVYDEKLSDHTGGATPPAILPRNVPGAWDGADFQWAPKHPGYEVPYGRVRVAASVSPLAISMAANGGAVSTKTQNSRLQIPRLTPISEITGKRLGYFPVREFVTTPGPPHQVEGAQFRFRGYVRIRYVRLYRKRKPDAALKKLSIVPARIPRWW